MGSRSRFVAAFVLIASLSVTALIASAQNAPDYNPHQFEFGTAEFKEVWDRTDLPVEEGVTERTWLWGPGANTPLLQEPYEEADDGERQVQYTDKSRMEMPWSDDADPTSPWFITQGLLAYELMSGRIQVGDTTFEDAFPAQIQIAGDPDSHGPTYATLGMHLDSQPRSDGNLILDFLHTGGHIETFQHLDVYGVTDVDGTWQNVDGIDQPIADVFWEFMTSSGPVYEDGVLLTGQVVESPFYAVGYPLTPAYWTWVKVNNVEQNVLVQCFERRCLTYTPDNPSAWQVESGNVGQHYFEWRYNQVGQPSPPDDDDADDGVDDGVDDGEPAPDPTPTTTPTVPAPSIFSVTPQLSTNPVGEEHTITVEVRDQVAIPFEGASVSASVTNTTTDGDAHLNVALTPGDATTDEDGVATLSYTGTAAGTDTITVSVHGITQTQNVTKIWVAPFLELDPEDQENPVGTEFKLTAALIVPTTENIDGDAVELDGSDDFDVEISRQDNGTTTVLDEVDNDFETSINANGEIEVTYTGPENPAADTITVSVEHEGQTVTASTTKTWVPGPPAELTLAVEENDDSENASMMVLIQPSETVSVDSSVSLEAFVEDEFENPVPGVIVHFYSDRPAPDTKLYTATTDEDGNAVVESHNHTTAETETITAVEQENDQADRKSDQIIIQWTAGAPASLTLDLWAPQGQEASEINEVGDRHRVVATVEDQYANLVPDASVTFTFQENSAHYELPDEYGVFDPDAADPGATYDVGKNEEGTNSVGRIGLSYEGETTGDDVITATVTDSTDPDLTDTSDKFWCSAIVTDEDTIQGAVNAVSENAIICVESGTYQENVTVETDGITFLGHNAGVDPRDGTRTDESKVGTASGAFTLEADNVVVDGFELTNVTTGTAAIVTSEGNSGYQILNNHIHGNDLGVRLRSNGTNQTLVSTNFFKDNDVANDGVAKGLNTGFGAGRMLGNSVIEDNLFTGHWDGEDSYSIHLINNPDSDYTDIEISRNVVHTSIVLIDVDGLTVEDNEVNMEFDTDSTSAMLIGGGVSNATISGNILKNAGRGLGIFTFFSGGNQNITVTGNQIVNNNDGIDVNDDVSSGNIVINNNKIAGNTDGLINQDSGTLDATGNWWGDPTGPSGEGSGGGDSVSENVDFSDWLTADPF